jgi:hypothetical protein
MLNLHLVNNLHLGQKKGFIFIKPLWPVVGTAGLFHEPLCLERNGPKLTHFFRCFLFKEILLQTSLIRISVNKKGPDNVGPFWSSVGTAGFEPATLPTVSRDAPFSLELMIR